MSSISNAALRVAGIALAATSLSVMPAQAQTQTAAGNDVKATPFNYAIKDGKRVPKGNRVTNADGSWREETRQGKCLTVKESSAQGEVKTTRRCDQ